MNKRTQYSVISDNVFGTSGPWPVMVAPQDDWSDERLSHIIFERNQYFSDFGNTSTLSLQPSVICSFNGTNLTNRNNIIDASSQGTYFTGILVKKNTVAPVPENVEIYHNTIYKYADPNGQIWNGIEVLDTCGAITIRNNLVEFPYVCAGHFSVHNLSPNTEYSNNVLNSTVTFEDPDHTDPLQRSFRLHQNSLSAIDMGYVVPSVHQDFDGNSRPLGNGYDIGAVEYIPPISIDDFNHVENSIFYPNPTNGIVHFKTEISIQELQIFDITGRLIFHQNNPQQINLSHLTAGVYVVKSTASDGTKITQKLLITD